MRLDRKLFWSYIVIILIAISTSFTLFTVASNQFLTYRLMDSMRKELKLIEENFGVFNSSNSQIGLFITENIMNLVQSDLIVLVDETLVFTQANTSEELREHATDLAYLEKHYITVSTRVMIGPRTFDIMLLSEKGSISEMNQLNLSILFITSLVSMLIAAFFGVYVQNNISRPIHLLKNKVRSFQESMEAPEVTIYTGDEIQELDEDIVRMARSIVNNDRKRKAFFENTSHELKTPLMNIRGYAEGLKDGIFSIDEAAEVIAQESESLRTLVESILYLSKLEDATHDRYQLQLVDLNEFLNGFYYKMAGLVADKNLEFKLNLDKSVQVKMDDDKMIRALSNIITNAVRYAKTVISIETIVENNVVEIRLFNDGPQIAEADLPYLFDRFYKGDKGQSGLGLAIVQSIMTTHHGTVEALNVEGGVCMSVKLPYVASSSKRRLNEMKKG
ncbi:HAMP domain-containing histidine kinase [Turicibacter bilis]|uniref:sensor histidine kinase n=1 Tax=Turicibacter bilis TaxID=2735723 RepID=UPI001BAEF960|nr:HAMP domain-containing sensor histidine kinase [Turicibacter bilis]MBS3203884.1 HAMP domain-containing histidine kinase [Turicibacter bilis]UUF11600.1 HAMP domain-containing histidine kinase [Turicibacter bilis]